MRSLVQYVVNALSLGSVYALLALGLAVLFGIMRLANFAQGSIIMLAGWAIFIISPSPTAWQVLGAVVVAVIASLVLERVAFRPLRGASASTLLIASFAIGYLLNNLAILVFDSRPRSVPLSPALARSIELGGIRFSRLDIITVAVTVILLAGLVVVLKRTAIGLQMRACAEDFAMARLLGVRSNRVIAGAFAISGVLAGISSFLFVARTGTVSASMGEQPVLIAFTAAVLGGLQTLQGAVAGGFALGALSVGMQTILPLSLRPFRDAFTLAIVIFVLLLRPQGIVARSGVHRERLV